MSWLDVLQTAGGVVAPILVFGGTWLGVRYSRKTGRESNLTANWDAYGTRMESLYQKHTEWTERQLAERDKRIDSLGNQVDSLSDRLDVLESKYRMAITYIRRIVSQLRHHVDPEEIDPPPDEIKPDL